MVSLKPKMGILHGLYLVQWQNMIENIYFGRPMSTYDNYELEHQLLLAITTHFHIEPQSIVNPKHETHQRGVQEYRAQYGDPMKYFYERILPFVGAGVFLPFSDGKLGAGIWSEAMFLESIGKPIFEVNENGIIIPLALHASRELSRDQTRARAQRVRKNA